MNEYVAIYEQAEDGGWGAYIPDLTGVVALGATRSEVAERIKEAVSAYQRICGIAGNRCRLPTTLPAP